MDGRSLAIHGLMGNWIPLSVTVEQELGVLTIAHRNIQRTITTTTLDKIIIAQKANTFGPGIFLSAAFRFLLPCDRMNGSLVSVKHLGNLLFKKNAKLRSIILIKISDCKKW